MNVSGDLLKPFDVVAAACTLSQKDFARGYDEPFMLISLDGQPDTLLNALVECPTDPLRPWYPRSESTGTGTMVTGGLTVEEIRRRVSSIPPPMTGQALAQILTRPHFAMPLRKRAQAKMGEERISIGRSAANDIVLFHDSVSKVQAWLEHDDNGRYFVTDVGSTNFTKVGGKLVEPLELVYFRLGDSVMFGEVQTRVVSPEVLWEAINVLDGR